MPFKGVRVLPEIPLDMPNLENLISEFEKSLVTPISENRHRNITSSSISSSGRIVKRIVEAYELRVVENAQQKQNEKKSFDTLGNIYNRRSFGPSMTVSTMHHKSNKNPQNSDSRDSRIVSMPDVDSTTHDDFAINRYRSNVKKRKNLKVWPKEPFDLENELMTYTSSLSKKSDTSVNRRNRIFYTSSSKNEREDKFKADKSSSLPLDDEDEDWGDLNQAILTYSRASSNSSDSSYKNLRINLYDFEDDDVLQRESSPISSLQSSSLCDDVTSSSGRINDNYLDFSFQGASKDDFQNADSTMSTGPNRNQKPHIVGAFLKLPMKIGNTNVTWVPTMDGKLPRKSSLKKIVSVFTSKSKKINKSKKKKPKEEQDCEEYLSSPRSQKSWYSACPDVINGLSSSPTFETFGRASNPDQIASRTDKSRIVLTELSREYLEANLESSESISEISTDYASFSSQANRWNIDSPSKRASMASSPRSQMSWGHFSISKCSHASFEKKAPKYPFVAHTKINQIDENAVTMMKEDITEEQGMKIEEKFDTSELESSIESSTSFRFTSLNISNSMPFEWVASSPKNVYDAPKRSHSSKSMNALDNIFLKVPWIQKIPRSKSDNFMGSAVDMRNKSNTRYATISLKNLRRLMSQEKLDIFGDSIDV